MRLRSPDVEQLDALELVDPCRSIEDVWKRYKPAVWARLQRASIPEDVAEDILQKAYLTMHERILEESEIPRPPGRTLATITTHLICNHVRARKRGRGNAGDEALEAEPAPSSRSSPERALEQARRRRFVQWILSLMPDDQSELLEMVDLMGLTAEEVAFELGVGAGAVRCRVFRARNCFRALAEEHMAELGGEL